MPAATTILVRLQVAVLREYYDTGNHCMLVQKALEAPGTGTRAPSEEPSTASVTVSDRDAPVKLDGSG